MPGSVPHLPPEVWSLVAWHGPVLTALAGLAMRIDFRDVAARKIQAVARALQRRTRVKLGDACRVYLRKGLPDTLRYFPLVGRVIRMHSTGASAGAPATIHIRATHAEILIYFDPMKHRVRHLRRRVLPPLPNH